VHSPTARRTPASPSLSVRPARSTRHPLVRIGMRCASLVLAIAGAVGAVIGSGCAPPSPVDPHGAMACGNLAVYVAEWPPEAVEAAVWGQARDAVTVRDAARVLHEAAEAWRAGGPVPAWRELFGDLGDVCAAAGFAYPRIPDQLPSSPVSPSPLPIGS